MKKSLSFSLSLLDAHPYIDTLKPHRNRSRMVMPFPPRFMLSQWSSIVVLAVACLQSRNWLPLQRSVVFSGQGVSLAGIFTWEKAPVGIVRLMGFYIPSIPRYVLLSPEAHVQQYWQIDCGCYFCVHPYLGPQSDNKLIKSRLGYLQGGVLNLTFSYLLLWFVRISLASLRHRSCPKCHHDCIQPLVCITECGYHYREAREEKCHTPLPVGSAPWGTQYAKSSLWRWNWEVELSRETLACDREVSRVRSWEK